MSRKNITFIVVGVLVVVAAGFWYWSQKRAEAPETPAAAEVEDGLGAAAEVKDGLGAETFNKTNNPLSGELPETNPFQVNTNPFK